MDRLDRTARRRLLKEDEAWIGKPLGANPPRRAAEAHVRHLALMLRDTNVAHRAIQASAYAATLFDATMAQEKKGPTACAKGCFHCCTKLVMVTLPDIFRLADTVRGNSGKVGEVLAAAGLARAITQGQTPRESLPCPVLTDQACSAYAVRPIPCRFLLSQSLDACVRIFGEDSKEAFPYTDGTVMVRQRMDQIVQAALILSGLPPYHYELIQSLAAALKTDDAETRWLAGEPIFAGIAVNAKDAAAGGLAAAEQLAEGLRHTI